MTDPIAKVSGHASRHMTVRAFLMNNDLQKLKSTWSMQDHFRKFNERKTTHNAWQKLHLHDVSPARFFEDVEAMFQKHFAMQWCSDKLIKLTLASVHPVSVAFARWSLNKPVSDTPTLSPMHDATIKPSCFMMHIAKNASSENIKSEHFFDTHMSAIEEIPEGENLFTSSDPAAISFRKCIEINWLPLALTTQLVESKVKDASFVKTTGKEEANASMMAVMRSVITPQATATAKSSDAFENRTGTNENAKDHAGGNVKNEAVLTCNDDRMKELDDMSHGELNHCRKVLNIHEHCRNHRHKETLSKFMANKDKNENENEAVKKTGVNHAPLLLGMVQIGAIHDAQRELMIEELYLRNIIVDTKETTTNLKDQLLQNECPGCTDCKSKKKFKPKLLSSADWSKDMLTDALTKIAAVRLERINDVDEVTTTIN